MGNTSDTASGLTGLYVRALVWYLLGMALLWAVGFESIYAHPTPFYALNHPAFDGLAVPFTMGAAFAMAYWRGSRRFVARSDTRTALWFVLAGLLLAAAAGGAWLNTLLTGEAFLDVLRNEAGALVWHALAFGTFLVFFTALMRGLGRLDWFAEEITERDARRMLAGILLFAMVFPCVIAMLRDGPEGIAQAYRRETYEYIGDIGKTSSIRTLFSRYMDILPYLSLHARAAPPGPIALLWVMSYVVGRGAMALSLATVAVGASAVIPLYYWARDLCGRRVALTCCMVYACIPSIVLFTATSAEMLFMPFTIATLFLFDRALRRGGIGYAVGAGLLFGVLALLKFTLIGVGAYFALAGLWRLRVREERMRVLRTALVMAAACLAFHATVRWWTGFDIVACFWAAKTHFDMDQAKLDLITPRLPGWTYRFINPLCWFYFAGIPASLLFLRRIFRPDPAARGLFLVMALTLFALNLLYLGRGEGERSALYIFPFIALPAAHMLDEIGRRTASVAPLLATLAFLAFQCWLTESFFYAYW